MLMSASLYLISVCLTKITCCLMRPRTWWNLIHAHFRGTLRYSPPVISSNANLNNDCRLGLRNIHLLYEITHPLAFSGEEWKADMLCLSRKLRTVLVCRIVRLAWKWPCYAGRRNVVAETIVDYTFPFVVLLQRGGILSGESRPEPGTLLSFFFREITSFRSSQRRKICAVTGEANRKCALGFKTHTRFCSKCFSLRLQLNFDLSR